MGTIQATAVRTRCPRPAMAMTPTVRTAAGARNESLTPAARPMARPAMARAGIRRSRPAYALTRIAAAASVNATPVMSLSASPAWNSTSIWAPSPTLAPIIACGPRP